MSHPPPGPPQGSPKLSPPAGAVSASNAASTNYRSNPMSVSSMLSGPSAFPAAGASHGRSYSDSRGGGNLLPPFGGNYEHKERLFSGPPENARGTPTNGGKAIGVDREREADKGRNEYIPRLTTAGERAYPPLPSAFARESPYSTVLPDQATLSAHREEERRRSAISPHQQSAPRPSLPPNNNSSNSSSSSAHFSSHAAHHLARPLPLSNPLHHSPLPPVRPPQQQPSQHKQPNEQHHHQRERDSKPPTTNYSSWTPHSSHSSTLPLRSEFSASPHDHPPPRTTLDHEPLSRIPPYSHRSPNQQPSSAPLPRPSIPQQQQQQQREHQQGHRNPESTFFPHPSNGSATTNHPRHPQASDRAPPAHAHPAEEGRFVAPNNPGSATATASGMSIPKFQRDTFRERERSRETELPREREQQMRWENKATPSPTVHSHTHKRKRSEIIATPVLPPASTTAPLADLPPPPPPPSHVAAPAVIPPFQPPHPVVVNPVNGSNPVEGRNTVVSKALPPKLTTALFTFAEQRKGEVRSSMIRVKNEAVLQAIVPKSCDDPPLFLPTTLTTSSPTSTSAPSTKRPHLGRVIYTPFVNPATLVDGEVLRNNVGGSIEVVIDIGWLDGVGFELGDPEFFDGNFLADGAELSFPHASRSTVVPVETSAVVVTADGEAGDVAARGDEGEKSIFDLGPFSRRKLWGTDVYTDDSDLLCICLHSGWLRLLPPPSSSIPSTTTAKSTSPPTSAIAGPTTMDLDSTKADEKGPEKLSIPVGEKRSGSIIVRMVVAPTLLRYQSSIRQSLKSRNWGNGHDGVSLMIESIGFVQDRIKPQGIAYTKSLAGKFLRTFIQSASSSASLPSISPASTTPSHIIDDDSPDHQEAIATENVNGNGKMMVDATTVDGGDNGDDLAAKLIGFEASFILKAQGKNVLLIHQTA